MATDTIRLTQTDLNAMLFCLGVLLIWSVFSLIFILILSNRVETCEIKLAVCERFLKWLEKNDARCAEVTDPVPVAEACCDCPVNPDVCSECQMACSDKCGCWCHGPKREAMLED